MGKIEDSILENYKKALQEGNMAQAKISVNLAKILKDLIEQDGFIDFNAPQQLTNLIAGDFFQSFPYRYYPGQGVVVVANTAVNLTNSENKLFYLFSNNETCGENIKLITREEIKSHMWGDNHVTRNAIRILIKRLRAKIEPDPSNPQIILSYNKKGYIFVGKRTNQSEQE